MKSTKTDSYLHVQFDYLLIDGYNIIHDWQNLAELAQTSLELARDALIHTLQNYQGTNGITTILVFDAHKINSAENIIRQGNITIVYTQEYETADAYIERTVEVLRTSDLRLPLQTYRIAVATSDSVEQVIIMAKGAYRLSSQDLLKAINHAEEEITRKINQSRPIKQNQLLDNLDPEMAKWLEKMRLSK
jgi:predicted RNA-binding protein with PIN domain